MIWWPGKNSRDKGGNKKNPSTPKGKKTKNKGGHWGGSAGNNPGSQGGPAKPHGK